MIPDPLHPALVHLPLAVAALVPLFALVTAIGIRKRWLPVQTWAVVLLLQVLLVGSGWIAVETGEHEEDRVESFVAERPLERHEEHAEQFLAIAGAMLLVVGSGLLPGPVGSTARVLAIVGAVSVLGLGARVGHSGGELVYRHGAASAYVADASPPMADRRHHRASDDD